MTPTAGNSRRRQRSTRVVVAVLLLLGAAAAVAGTAVTGSWLAVTVAGGFAVLLGTVATKITHSELMISRFQAGRDRADQAKAFRDFDARRSARGPSRGSPEIRRHGGTPPGGAAGACPSPRRESRGRSAELVGFPRRCNRQCIRIA